ncbi:PREDICTED: inactive protein FRIGIDA isoform X2 [Tarenaya hassleriana]|uniref:inactive protein FRIGIDA isoform X2 n=1 Tax=Tarenaya hassleriana TaxID=28532 RepID=UPI0008FD537B|nr:PREDICTED: inactive protein FRIGIDA isoform X2 [Tarenaya hassleriana]
MTAADPESSTVDIPTLQRQQQPEHTGTEIPICESQEHEQHQFVKSIGDLAALSAAINAFKRKYDDMQSHIQFIENAIDARLAGVNVGGGVGASSSSVLPPEIDLPENKPPQESGTVVPESSEMPEVKHLCESMSSKGLRKYILSNIAEPAKLMEEIPEALKLAKDPSKLVFESIGKFYLQGRRAYTKDSPMITSRKASLLAMECFLLMADPDAAKTMVENSTKVEAKKAAFAWRKRLMSEGGLANAQTMDARGLLLLIACFGVPSTFGDLDLDLLDLLRQSKPSEISNALRRSAFLVPRIPGLTCYLECYKIHEGKQICGFVTFPEVCSVCHVY